MIIKVLGPGCTKCTEAEFLVNAVVAEKKFPATVEKVTDLKEIMRFGVMSTPAVVVDGVVKCVGRIPTKAEVAVWIDDALAQGILQTSVSGGCCDGKKC